MDNQKLLVRNRLRERKKQPPVPPTELHPVPGPLTLAAMQDQSNMGNGKKAKKRKINNNILVDIGHVGEGPHDIAPVFAPAEDANDADAVSTTAPVTGCETVFETVIELNDSNTTTEDEEDGSTSQTNTQGDNEDETTDRLIEAISATSNVTSPDGTIRTTSVKLCNKDGIPIADIFLPKSSTTAKAAPKAVAGGERPIERNSPVARPVNNIVGKATNQTRTAPVRVSNPYNQPTTTHSVRRTAVQTRTDLPEEDAGGSTATQLTSEATAPINQAPFSTPRTLTSDEIMSEDAKVQQLTAADNRLISVYGDTIRQNDGLHLHGGVDEELSTLHRDWYI